MVREDTAGHRSAFRFEELTYAVGGIRGPGAVSKKAGLEECAGRVLILVNTGQASFTRERREVVQPVVRTITGIKFLPREYAYSWERN